jgi:beta-glucanase (GH16 family)
MTIQISCFIRKVVLVLFLFSEISFISCGKDGDENPTPVETLPELTVNDIQIERSGREEIGRFYFSLNKSFTKSVSFDYVLKDGSAISSKDYQANAGNIVIQANQTSGSVEVSIKANTLREPNLNFQIILSNPINCTIKKGTGECTIIAENGSKLPTSSVGYITPAQYPDKTLVWSDEFDGNSLNTAFWNQEIGNGANGWGNNELQYYTNSKKNTLVSEGNLIIEARQESLDGFNYTSARLTTKNKKEITFGRIDIRAKLPKGKGIWPALWMLGANISSVSWPACGEIDIMELIGSSPDIVHGTLHWKGSNGHVYQGKSKGSSTGDFSNEFHVFSLVWEKDLLIWMVDDVEYFRMTKTAFGSDNYPFNDPQFFIFNVAVGGDWPGSPDVNTQFPQRMFVDYVRVFQ